MRLFVKGKKERIGKRSDEAEPPVWCDVCYPVFNRKCVKS